MEAIQQNFCLSVVACFDHQHMFLRYSAILNWSSFLLAFRRIDFDAEIKESLVTIHAEAYSNIPFQHFTLVHLKSDLSFSSCPEATMKEHYYCSLDLQNLGLTMVSKKVYKHLSGRCMVAIHNQSCRYQCFWFHIELIHNFQRVIRSDLDHHKCPFSILFCQLNLGMHL